MQRLQIIVWLLLLVLLCGCTAQVQPDVLPEALPETVSEPIPEAAQETRENPEPVLEEAVIEEPEEEYALLPAEPVWLLGRLPETWSAGEMQWAERGSVLEAIAPLRLSDAEALLDGLADGLTLDELSWEKTEWDEEYGMFVRRGTARCTAYFVATADEESAVLTDFILKGVMQ